MTTNTRMTYSGLVGMFVAFMTAMECYRDEEGNIGNYLTIRRGKNPNKPCWLTGKNSRFRADWPAMKRAAWEAGINLAYHQGKGWFIGWPEDVGTTINGRHKSNNTRNKNFVEDVRHVNMISDPDQKSRILKAVNAKRKSPVTFDQIEESITTMLKFLGVSVGHKAIPLLTEFILAQDETEDEDD